MCKIDDARMRVEACAFSDRTQTSAVSSPLLQQTLVVVSAVQHQLSLIPHISTFLCDASSECFVLAFFLFVWVFFFLFRSSFCCNFLFLCILEQLLSCKDGTNNGELESEVDF